MDLVLQKRRKNASMDLLQKRLDGSGVHQESVVTPILL